MKIKCFNCNKEFTPNTYNTKIYGPYVEIDCPFCLDKYEGKLVTFVRKQIGKHSVASAVAAMKMIKMAEFIELNSSEYYKERGLRHGRKKVRNIRN